MILIKLPTTLCSALFYCSIIYYIIASNKTGAHWTYLAWVKQKTKPMPICLDNFLIYINKCESNLSNTIFFFTSATHRVSVANIWWKSAWLHCTTQATPLYSSNASKFHRECFQNAISPERIILTPMGVEHVSARAIKQCTITVQKGAFMVRNAAHTLALNFLFQTWKPYRSIACSKYSNWIPPASCYLHNSPQEKWILWIVIFLSFI